MKVSGKKPRLRQAANRYAKWRLKLVGKYTVLVKMV
jgi:hypothetical protein